MLVFLLDGSIPSPYRPGEDRQKAEIHNAKALKIASPRMMAAWARKIAVCQIALRKTRRRCRYRNSSGGGSGWRRVGSWITMGRKDSWLYNITKIHV
jgi:hypothetical protein